jgi:Cu2+-exporting ATPase
VFDKTGTLTTGSPAILDTIINPDRKDFHEASVLSLAALLEVDSSHPIARAFCDVDVNRDAITSAVNHNNGVEGVLNGNLYRIGNARFTQPSAKSQNDALGHLWLADDSGWIAHFKLNDGLRDASVATIDSLHSRGLELHILSGDHPQAVAEVAKRTGINRWSAEQNPKMKMQYIEALQSAGKNVLMVGDGINDAPVLSVANVSMTVSGSSELANSTADFILTGHSLSLVDYVFVTSQKTRRIIKQNLLWALGYNLVAVPFAAAGLIEPWMAAVGMSLSSLLVVINSGRLANATIRSDTVLKPMKVT